VLELERLAESNRQALVVARHEAEIAAIARQEADRANTAKSEFLSRMSHELRTPLNSVLGFAQVLLMHDLTASQRESVGYIRSAGEHLLDLITDVMEISRIEAGALDLSLEAVHLDDVIASALNLIRAQADQRQIELPGGLGDNDLYVWADRQRLLQVLLNLLSNAVKYNRLGGRIELDGWSSGGIVSIAVGDTGIGISEVNQEKLFTPFERLGAEVTQIEGTGVGLALSQVLAEQMGGSIGVASVAGEGSTFTLELPECRPTEPGSASLRSVTGSMSSGDERQLVVLAIEDNVANVRLLEAVLGRVDNVTMRSAVDGGQGLLLAAQIKPDVVLLDLHLPDQGGESVLEHLRHDPATAAIPVVICSADAAPGQSRRLLDLGAWAYLTKPIDLNELYGLLDQIRAGPDRGSSRATDRPPVESLGIHRPRPEGLR
jgi:CheY-like chemotaxis protein